VIIGISGLAGSGKDTAADVLVGRYDFTKVSFADPMKKIARDVFAFSDEQLYGPSETRNAPDTRYPREHGPFNKIGDCLCCGAPVSWVRSTEPQCYLTTRFTLQQLGTEWGRVCYSNVWVVLAIRNARGDVVIPDVRFKNEVDGLRAAGAYLVRIVRPGSGLAGSAGQHMSETEQVSMPNEMFDAVIQNNRGLRELEEAVTDLVRRWGDR
jgi:hypothetical protein